MELNTLIVLSTTLPMERFFSCLQRLQLEVRTELYSVPHNYKQSVIYYLSALVRHVLKNTPIPYTVILIILGLAFGAASNVKQLRVLLDYTGIATMDPHLMLFVFLPTLIFESAFVMDVHTFRKTIGQSMLLAGPGLILCSFLTCLLAKYIFTYNWSWVAALMFGAIMSATDPVAVVALLKDLGMSEYTHIGRQFLYYLLFCRCFETTGYYN